MSTSTNIQNETVATIVESGTIPFSAKETTLKLNTETKRKIINDFLDHYLDFNQNLDSNEEIITKIRENLKKSKKNWYFTLVSTDNLVANDAFTKFQQDHKYSKNDLNLLEIKEEVKILKILNY